MLAYNNHRSPKNLCDIRYEKFLCVEQQKGARKYYASLGKKFYLLALRISSGIRDEARSSYYLTIFQHSNLEKIQRKLFTHLLRAIWGATACSLEKNLFNAGKSDYNIENVDSMEFAVRWFHVCTPMVYMSLDVTQSARVLSTLKGSCMKNGFISRSKISWIVKKSSVS
jgi:hypothetical protein